MIRSRKDNVSSISHTNLSSSSLDLFFLLLLMRLVSLLFKEHVVAHYCAAVNRVPQRANAIAPWTEPTQTGRILM